MRLFKSKESPEFKHLKHLLETNKFVSNKYEHCDNFTIYSINSNVLLNFSREMSGPLLYDYEIRCPYIKILRFCFTNNERKKLYKLAWKIQKKYNDKINNKDANELSREIKIAKSLILDLK